MSNGTFDGDSALFSTADETVGGNGAGNGKDEWATPPSIWRPLSRAVDGFDLDPAAGCEPSPIAAARFTEEDDGLRQSWYGDVWLNPPYSGNDKWLPKARNEARRDEVRSVFVLIPSRTDTSYWQEVQPDAEYVAFLRGRINFVGGESSAPFPTSILAFGDVPDRAVFAMKNAGPKGAEIVTPVKTEITKQATFDAIDAGDGGGA